MPPCYGGETIIALSLSRFKRRHIRWDVAGSASSVPNTHDETAKQAGLRSSAVMRPIAIHIAAILLAISLSQAKTSGRDLSKTSESQLDNLVTEPPHLEILSEEEESKEEITKEEDQLPILPPIILLDFGNNNTDDENATAEEKSKRTVNNGLGYGLDRNNLHPRKYNYYFPAGKSGTTVSIEESISPFLPKTIIEKVQPTSQKGYYFGTQQNSFVSQPSGIAGQSQAQSSSSVQYLNAQQLKDQPMFGSRAKPQSQGTGFTSYQKLSMKPPVSSYSIQNSGYRGGNVPASTQSPLAFSSTETVRYVTPSAANFANPQPASFHYASQGSQFAQSGTGQRQHAQSNINSHGFVSQSVETSTAAPLNYNPRYPASSQQTQPTNNGPRYSMENGVRYENKIFWKYPDGRVSDVPPTTYVETSYPEYLQSNGQHQQQVKSQGSHSIYEASTTENSVLSQGPVQFPAVSEPSGQEPNQFVSSESLTASLPQQQVYRLGYQNLVSQRLNANQPQQRKPTVATSYSFSTSGRLQSNRHKPAYSSLYRPVTSRYMVNSPNAEYTDGYTTEPTVNATTPISNFFSATDSSRVASKYSPKVQNYLDTILSAPEETKKQSLPSNDLNSYSNLQYSDLLNYNPSISEYIRNPASILNVRPTFVQTGNSLIPVIILRVDGVSPIQTKSTPNINLKALLQQYLIQYANSIQELARPSTYDLGTDSVASGQSQTGTKSPVLDLIRLTQQDARVTYDPNDYIGRTSYETSNLEIPKSFADSHFGERSTVRQKMKNVQIIDDPRFTSYKTKN
ncbi:uncharacterized protein LOC116431782 [Nomia melanderi]|uniref:uncharacterized protein LOC116431782 n=1 Tax=Nomia melanderi TaxID=2448451 RepID=UPI0013041772|nr:uncharacterized protein LOC116431782 [Nomia melanderi]